MASHYSQHFNTRETPQSQPIPDSSQVANAAGGFAWAVDDWKRLQRFLILGAEGGSYYASERKLTKENAEAVLRCIKADGPRTVSCIVEISQESRAPKNDPALFALAMCAGLGDNKTKQMALVALPKVARIGTHLFHFAEYIQAFRGYGRGLRRAVASWYTSQSGRELALQAIKYQQRDGWSHRDLLRLSHPHALNEEQALSFDWICRGLKNIPDVQQLPEALSPIIGFELAKGAEEKSLVEIIRKYKLPMEAIPTEKRTKSVWREILPHLGMTALIRNLGNLSKQEVLAKGQWDIIRAVTERLTWQDQIKKGRIHPIALLAALITYQSGHGARGHGEWEVVPEVSDALNKAFYLAFQNVEPTNKRFVLALDVSGSMESGNVAGIPGITPRVAAAAMAMVTYKTEKQVALVAFSGGMIPIDISRCHRLDDVVKKTSDLSFDATDCALPMLWALNKKVQADVFIILTDNETWAGNIHPSQALQKYRREMNIPAKLVTVGMTSGGFTIADPEDAGMFDCVGFDTATPALISQFVAGNI